MTVNADVAAVVADRASEYVNVTVVPAEFVDADTNVGVTVSAVELFVTEVAARDAASFPEESWTAFESFPPVGSVYATVTVEPALIVGEIERTIVDPDAETLDGVMVVPSTTTVNALAVAVVADIASEYVSVICVPAVFVAAETNEGAVTSTVELFVTDVAARDEASLPVVSCTAAFEFAESLDGAVYATVTD